METLYISVKVDDHAGIVSLFDKRNNREYLMQDNFANIGRVMLPNQKWDGRYADLAKQKKPLLKQKENEMVFIFSDLLTEDGITTDISIRVYYCLLGDELYASYEIENNDKEEFVSHIMFPIVTGVDKKYADCRLVMPEQSPFGDSRVENPYAYGDGNHKDWTRSCNRKSVRYPQLLATAWMDYSDNNGGISFEQRSEQFDICDMGFERTIKKALDYKEENIDCLQFSLQSYPSVRYQEKRKGAQYIIGLHEGDWRVPAMRHRIWLKRILRFPEIPEKFKKSLGWHFVFMKQQDETVYFTYEDLPQMAEAVLEAGMNHLMVFGWYPHGHDNEYPFGYYANKDWGGRKFLQKQLDVCQKKGCSVIPFFNGTLLDISTKGYKQGGFKWPVIGRSGKPYCGTEFSRANNDMGFYNASISTSTRNMTLLDVCITSKEVKQWWKKTIRRIVKEYHFQNLQLDQIAHKSYVCYDGSHGHERPEYAYTRELAKLLGQVRSLVKADNKEGVMIGEGMTDLTAQYCDGFWNWHQVFNKPQIMRYSIPWMNYSHEVDANEFDVVNICFAEKILLDLKIEGGTRMVTDYPLFCNHLRSLARLKGKLGTAYINGEYFLQDDLLKVSDRGCVIRMYQDKNQIAIVAANITKQRQDAAFTISFLLKESKMTNLQETIKMKDGRAYTFKLQPYEVVVLEGMKGMKREDTRDER